MSFSACFPQSPSKGGELEHQKSNLSASEWIELRYTKANAIICNVFNKYYNGSARAVDPFVIKSLQEEETRLFSIQCYIEQGPTERSRSRKESEVTTKIESSPPFKSRFFTLCGGYFGGNASIMRTWEALGKVDRIEAMREYTSIVDKILPGWDQESEIPISKQEKSWTKDQNVNACGTCGNSFTLQNRRHHCRMCFDIYCVFCCNEVLELALCPGAPARQQRICRQCSKEIQEQKSLKEVLGILRQNLDIEQSIKEIEIVTRATIQAKQTEEINLRKKAKQIGCNMQAVDFKIKKTFEKNNTNKEKNSLYILQSFPFYDKKKRTMILTTTTPAAHKFIPHVTCEAKNQLQFANRQLLMSLKVAQCRSKIFVEQMEIQLEILREAICFGTCQWHVILPLMAKYCSFKELEKLVFVSRTIKEVIEYHQLFHKCVLYMDVGCDRRPILWQSCCLQEKATQQYVSDLVAKVIGSNSNSNSNSDSNSDSSSSSSSTNANQVELVRSMSSTCSEELYKTLLMVETDPKKAQIWRRVYQLILETKASNEEFEIQIQNDIQRTFGTSSLRKKHTKRFYSSNQSTFFSSTNTSTTTTTSTSTSTSSIVYLPEVPLDLCKLTLSNLLRSFSKINQQVGYCQGMDSLGAMILSIVQWNEFQAFWIFTSMFVSSKYQLNLLFCKPNLPLLSVRFYQLEQLMKIHVPTIAFCFFQKNNFPISVLSTGWFLTLFTNLETFSYEMVVRILDVFFVFGWKWIFQIILVIFERLEKKILFLENFEEKIAQIFYQLSEFQEVEEFTKIDKLFVRAMQFQITNHQLLILEKEFYQQQQHHHHHHHSSSSSSSSSRSRSRSRSRSSSSRKNTKVVLSPSKGKQVADPLNAQIKSSSSTTSATTITAQPLSSSSSLTSFQVPVISPVLNSSSPLELKGKKIHLPSSYSSSSSSSSSSFSSSVEKSSRIHEKKLSSPRDATSVW